MDIKKLAQESIAAKEFAYTPYSHFRVGAALLTNLFVQQVLPVHRYAVT